LDKQKGGTGPLLQPGRILKKEQGATSPRQGQKKKELTSGRKNIDRKQKQKKRKRRRTRLGGKERNEKGSMKEDSSGRATKKSEDGQERKEGPRQREAPTPSRFGGTERRAEEREGFQKKKTTVSV